MPSHDSLSSFHEPVREWFRASFEAPTAAQELGWPAIQSGESTLILAPTGSGKTLAAFMVAIDRLMCAAVALSRLLARPRAPLRRTGVSRTQRPLEEVARFLGGFEPQSNGVMESWSDAATPVEVIDHEIESVLGDMPVSTTPTLHHSNAP